MIKFRADNEDGKKAFVGIGLTEDNLRLLRDARPIHIKGEEMGIENDIFIFYGETNKDLTKIVKPMFHDKTEIRIGSFT